MDASSGPEGAIDRCIAEHFIDQDEAGPRLLLETHGEALNSYLHWQFGSGDRPSLSRDQIEDVLMLTVQKYWRSPGLYDESRGRLRTWLKTVALNQGRDYLRREPKFAPLPDEPHSLEDSRLRTSNEPISGKACAKEKKRVKAILEIIAQDLSPLQRKVINADIAAGESVAADLLGAEFGISKSSVYTHRSNARARIEAELEKRGLGFGGKGGAHR